jgi:hypothetical protein
MKNVLFIWTPKVAGTSIYSVLKEHGCRKAVWPEQYRRFNSQGSVTFGHISVFALLERGIIKRSYFNSAFKFCFVRSPRDRMVSLYEYAKKVKHIGSKVSFEAFCRRIAKGVPRLGLHNARPFQQANPQYKWIYRRGKCCMDFVGRYERLETDIQVVFRELGIRDTLPVLNRSKRRPYQEYYNDTTEKLVDQIYQKDIELFGYSY